jgi:chorismate mutase
MPAAPEAAPSFESQTAQLRRCIDELDAEIIRLFQRRAALSRQVGALRVASGGLRLALARERVILNRYADKLGPDGTDLALLVLRAGRGRLLAPAPDEGSEPWCK